MATATPPLTIQPTPTANIGVPSGAGMFGTGLTIGVTRGLDLTGVTPTAGAAYIADELAQPFHCQACENGLGTFLSRPLDFGHANRR